MRKFMIVGNIKYFLILFTYIFIIYFLMWLFKCFCHIQGCS